MNMMEKQKLKHEGFNIKFLFSSADAFTAIPGTVKLPLVITNALHKVIQNGLFNTCFHFTIKLLNPSFNTDTQGWFATGGNLEYYAGDSEDETGGCVKVTNIKRRIV